MGTHPIAFEIHPSSGVPIYSQIVDQVITLIAGGKLKPGELLPSVRTVAKHLTINPMTVSKAYSRLEAEGVVERVRGLGMRVCKPNQNASLTERKSQFRKLLAPALLRAHQLGLNESQIQQVTDSLLKELSK